MSILPDMYAQRPRVSVYISGNAGVPVLQLICYTFMASLYLYRHLLHLIIVFKYKATVNQEKFHIVI